MKGQKYQVQDRRITRPGVPGTGPGGDLVMNKEYQAAKGDGDHQQEAGIPGMGQEEEENQLKGQENKLRSRRNRSKQEYQLQGQEENHFKGHVYQMQN